jgi:serine protease Do
MLKSKNLWGAVALVIVGVIFGAVLVSGFGLVRPSLADIKLGASKAPVDLNADATSFSKAFIEVAKNVTPEVVQITVVAKTDNPHQGNNFFFNPFQDMPKEEEGSGSGIIISADGYIVTNNHVVNKATSVKVGLSDNRSYTAKVIGTDPLTDIAVIKINAHDLPVAYLGDSDSLKVGQWVMAIGNPLALTSTVTAGIVSALGRGQLGLINDRNNKDGRYGVEDFIQTDAVINPGNSGGALVDLSGAVVGVNAAIATSTGSYIGYGFAIPINLVKSVTKELIAYGKVTRGYIGVQITPVDDATAKAIGLDKPHGVMIQELVPGGAASKEDIKPGDVILKVDGREVNQANELQSYVATKSAGASVNLKIFRNGKELDRKVTLKQRDEDSKTEAVADNDDADNGTESKSSTVNFDKIGMSVSNLTKQDKTEFKVSEGIKIDDITMYGEAMNHGLIKGSVITEADRQPVKDVSQFKKILASKKGSAILLKVKDKQGTNRFVGLEIPE